MRRALLAGFVLLALAAAGGFGIRFAAMRPGSLPQTGDLVVPRGHLRTVTAALQGASVLAPGDGNRLLFMALARLTEREAPLHAAEFRFPAHASMLAVLGILRHARPVQHQITIPEGLTAVQIAALVLRAPALAGGLALPAEGAVLPQTYDYELGTSRAVLLERMQAAMQSALATSWASRDPSLPLATPAQMLALASIVERETGLPAERPLVAEVFTNRLRRGMRLQSDPTVAYGADGGLGGLPRPLTRSDLLQPNPYNTYVIAGLPPGPIAAPGLAALQAVAHPVAGALLYFVATGTGGHAFSASLADHLRNVTQLRAIEAARSGQMPTLDPFRPPPQVPTIDR